MTVYGKKSRSARLRASLRAHARWWVMILVGVLLMIGAGTAFAAIRLTGHGTLVVTASGIQELVVGTIRLTGPLSPGGTADVSVRVRNPNTFPVRVERATLLGGASRVSPPGCFAKVSGPLTVKAGYTLKPAEQVVIAPGQTKTVLLRKALALAASARAGCGFHIQLLIDATRQTPTIPPTSPGGGTPPPVESPSSPPSAGGSSTPPPPSASSSTPPPLDDGDDEPIPVGGSLPDD